MRFWIEYSPFTGEPQYAVETYGHTRVFPKLEYLSEFRGRLRGTRWTLFKNIVLTPLKNFATGKTYVNDKWLALRHGSAFAYILIRHKCEIADFLDTAIKNFSDHDR